MQRLWTLFIPVMLLFTSCAPKEDNNLAGFGVFCEMVANDAKPIALGAPTDKEELEQQWANFEVIADSYGVELYREDNFPVSVLFPAALTEGKSVPLIYKGNRLKQYEQYRTDVNNYKGNDPQELEQLARRFGRLLGYQSKGINELLSKSTNYRNLAVFEVTQQLSHLYYEDLEAAIDFYENTLGLNKVGEALFQISQDALIELHAHNEAHPKGQTKSTAIALLTNHLPEWYAYAQEQDIPIKYTYKPRDGGPHDGFVAIDPGGYLLEFEQFKQHPENELFMAVLAKASDLKTTKNGLPFYGSITWTYHKDLLKMQQFYEEKLGFQLVADQGWTKIYQTSPTGFIGLVDECRGMEDYAATKAVELEWSLTEFAAFDAYATQYWKSFRNQDGSLNGPEGYFYQISGAK